MGFHAGASPVEHVAKISNAFEICIDELRILQRGFSCSWKDGHGSKDRTCCCGDLLEWI